MEKPTVTIESVADQPEELEISGEIDYHSSDLLRNQLSSYFSRGGNNLRLNLAGVEFIDSTGLSVLLDAVKTARANSGAITLVKPSRQLIRVLSVSGFAPFFSIEYGDDFDLTTGSAEHAPDDDLLVESFEAEGKPENIAALRRSVTRFATALPFTAQELDDIKLAVGEATCNALRYGCPKGKESIHVTCSRRGRRFSVQISDSGPGFDPATVPQVKEGELSEGGRGIFFMRCLMDEVTFKFGNGTTVELVKYLPAAPNP